MWQAMPRPGSLLQLSASLDFSCSTALPANRVRCRAISDRNVYPEPSAFPYDALMYIAAENGEHCSQSVRCDLTLPMAPSQMP